jgi:hypothetical protein
MTTATVPQEVVDAALALWESLDPGDRLVIDDALEAYHTLPASLVVELTADDWEAAQAGSLTATRLLVGALMRAGMDRQALTLALTEP